MPRSVRAGSLNSVRSQLQCDTGCAPAPVAQRDPSSRPLRFELLRIETVSDVARRLRSRPPGVVPCRHREVELE